MQKRAEQHWNECEVDDSSQHEAAARHGGGAELTCSQKTLKSLERLTSG